MTKTEDRQRGTEPQGQRATGNRDRDPELRKDEMPESQRQRKKQEVEETGKDPSQEK